MGRLRPSDTRGEWGRQHTEAERERAGSRGRYGVEQSSRAAEEWKGNLQGRTGEERIRRTDEGGWDEKGHEARGWADVEHQARGGRANRQARPRTGSEALSSGGDRTNDLQCEVTCGAGAHRHSLLDPCRVGHGSATWGLGLSFNHQRRGSHRDCSRPCQRRQRPTESFRSQIRGYTGRHDDSARWHEI